MIAYSACMGENEGMELRCAYTRLYAGVYRSNIFTDLFRYVLHRLSSIIIDVFV